MHTEEVERAQKEFPESSVVGAESQAGPEIAALIEEAKKEWIRAQALFDSVSAPEMVDHAIHMIMAAEKKYSYLLRLAKVEIEDRVSVQGI